MSDTALEPTQIKKQVINNPKKDIKILNLTEWKDYCCDETFQRIKNILGTNYLTLDEITEKYSQLYENKSKPSINRYLKDFEEKGLVQIAGRVVKPDQKASEKLYSFSSHINYVDNQYANAWNDNKERAFELARKISVPLQYKFNTGFNINIISELISNYENVKLNKSIDLLKDLISKITSQNNESLNKLLGDIFNLQNDEVIVFYNNLKFISWFLFDNHLEDFINDLKTASSSDKITIDPVAECSDNKKEFLVEKDSEYMYMPNDFERKPIYFTHFGNWIQFMMDIRYGSILNILQTNNHPLSISEIYKKFTSAFNTLQNKYLCYRPTSTKDVDKLNTKLSDYLTNAKEKGLTIDLESKEAELLSESSIYRMVQDLKEAGLVVEAGLRVKNNAPKDQLLYTSIAKTIIYFEDSDEFWLQEETWKKVSSLIQKILEYSFNKKIQDSEKFHKLFTSIVTKRFNFFKYSLLEPESEEIVKFFFSSLNNTELNALMDALGTTAYFYNNESVIQTKHEMIDLFQ